MVAVMNKVLTAPIPDIRAQRPDLPDALVKIIRKMLTRDKAKRYQTIREVALDLERVSVAAPASRPATPATKVAAPAATVAAPAATVVAEAPATVLAESAPAPKPAALPQVRPPACPARMLWIGGGVAAVLLCVVAAAIGLFSAAPAAVTWLNIGHVAKTVTPAALVQAAPTSAPTQPPAPTSPPVQPAQPTDTPSAPPTQPAPTAPPAGPKLKVGVVIDVGGIDDKSYNQSAWAGAQKAANDFGLVVQNIQAKQPSDYGVIIDQFAAQGDDVIIAVGWTMGDTTAIMARKYPNIRFAIVDFAYTPTKGSAACPDTVKDCYADGGLTNVTSLMFREDQAGFLAGVVAAGMTKTGTVCTAAGMDIPPVARYVTGFQSGAKWMKPDVKTLNAFMQTFADPAVGRNTGYNLIAQGCDVIFNVGGNAGNGALLAAKEKGLLAIGVDSDQYLTFPDVQSALLTSAVKNVDVAVYQYLQGVSNGTVRPGAIAADIKNNAVGLAPYHDWDGKIPDAVKGRVKEATDGLMTGMLNPGGGGGAGGLPLGVLAPLSGSVPTFGVSTRNGVLLAVQQWNAKGGVLGKMIAPDVVDSQCQADAAAQAAKKIIGQDGVHYIIGEVCSAASIPVSQIAEANHVVQISPASTNLAVTQNADGSVKQFVFRACFVDPFQGNVMARFALSKGYKTAFVMLDPTNNYVRGLADAFSSAFQQNGGQIVARQGYNSKDTDFSLILKKVADSKAQILYVPDYYNVVNRVGQQAKAMGLAAVLMGGDGWDSTDLDVKALDGGYYTNHFDAADPNPQTVGFIKDYGAAYQDAQGNPLVPDALAALAYDATNLMLTAIQQAGVDDPVKVKDMLMQTKFFGVTGLLVFDPMHNPIKGAVIMGVQNGRRAYVTTVGP
jgi:branched-chain amino acid transport system substrate-binding protein